jgi:hypothetical protein
MRTIPAALAAACLCLVAAPSGRAATLDFEGSVSLTIGTLPFATVSGVGVATLNGDGWPEPLETLTLPPSFAAASFTMPITDPATPITRIDFEARNLAGTLTGGNALNGPLGISGLVRLCAPFIIFECGINLTIPFTQGGTRGIGLGGAPLTASEGLFGRFTLTGAEWTAGAAQITGISTDNGGISTRTASGFVHDPLSATAASIAHDGGTLQLVSPFVVHRNGELLAAAFAQLNVRFVPEPGAFLLLAAGVGGLAALGRRRWRA